MLKLSNEQLTKLTLHTAGINSILTEALLNVSPEESSGVQEEVEIDVFVIGGDSMKDEPETLNLDALCGEWKGGKRMARLTIFKAELGYMVAWGKKPKKGEVGDCYPIEKVNGKLSIRYNAGHAYLYYDESTDILKVYPVGEYTRVETGKK